MQAKRSTTVGSKQARKARNHGAIYTADVLALKPVCLRLKPLPTNGVDVLGVFVCGRLRLVRTIPLFPQGGGFQWPLS